MTTRYGLPDVKMLLLNGVSLTGHVTDLTETREAVVQEVTAAGDEGDVWVSVGLKRFNASLQSIYAYSPVVEEIEKEIAASKKTPGILDYGWEGMAAGDPFTHVDAVFGTLEKSGTRDQIHSLSASFQSDGEPQEGVVAVPFEDLDHSTAPANYSVLYDRGSGAASTATVVVWVESLELDGATNCRIRVRHSATQGGTYTLALSNLATFTEAPLVQVRTGVTLSRYVRIDASFTSVGTDSTVRAALGLI